MKNATHVNDHSDTCVLAMVNRQTYWAFNLFTKFCVIAGIDRLYRRHLSMSVVGPLPHFRATNPAIKAIRDGVGPHEYDLFLSSIRIAIFKVRPDLSVTTLDQLKMATL